MTLEENYMHRCLQLAQLGAGNVAPNPMVGAVLVHDNLIIGEGYHKKYGEAHAEVNCINSVRKQHIHLVSASTLYVSLEPCAHYGKTPPCADLILKYNIPKVVVGCRDIFKEVDGRGIQKLESAGVIVVQGILANEGKGLNKRFFTYHQKERPFIILKWAQTINGKIGLYSDLIPKRRTLISNEFTNRIVHKWRSHEAAIMVGTNTVLHDDPSLTTRFWTGKNALRAIIDMNLRLPVHLKIFNKETNTVIFNKAKNVKESKLDFYKLEPGDELDEIIKAMYAMNIQSVLVEGGAMLLQSFIDAGLWDEVRLICNEQMVIDEGINAPVLKKCVLQKKERYDNDTISYFLPR